MSAAPHPAGPEPATQPAPGDDLRAQVTRLTRELAELRDVVDAAAAAADAGGHAAAPAPPATPANKPGPAPVQLGELGPWVQDWLLPTFRRMPGGPRGRWCTQWWRHAEAVIRLQALHCSYRELFAAGGAGPGTWLRDHLDPALEHLLANDGPFTTCSTDPQRHDPLDPLPAAPVPAELLAPAAAGAGAAPSGSKPP